MNTFRTVFLILVILFSAGLIIYLFLNLLQRDTFSLYLQPDSPLALSEQNQQKLQDSYTILLAGDVMLDRGVGFYVAQRGGGDWRFPWYFVADQLSSADLVFLNHEGVMSDVGQDAGGVYSFNFPLSALDGLLFAGVDVVSLANNHSFDWGGVALCDTRRRLSKYGIGSVGAGCSYAEASAPHIHVFDDGSRVGFLGYTSFHSLGVAGDTSPGISDYTLDVMRKDVAALKEDVDVVFVSLHWGEEYQSRSNMKQQQVGRALIDAGADVIVGHHPHVIQETEEYNGGWIFYSLGNFIFDQYFSAETMEGLVAAVIVQGGVIASVDSRKVFLNSYYQPMFTHLE